MAIVKIHPIRLVGAWDGGYALDKHIVSSLFIGYSKLGRAEFHTTRSAAVEFLYRLKYRFDKSAVEPIAETAAEFITKQWKVEFDAIIAVPPSHPRVVQPVTAVAESLAARINIPLCKNCLRKVKKTSPMKNEVDYDKRREGLHEAFVVARRTTEGRRFLLLDDLFGSGATVSHVTQGLKEQGKAAAIYVLTLTAK